MSDDSFVEDSILEILIPQASDLDIEEILQSAEDTTPGALISSIPQRDILFFDESLPVYAVLRTILRDEDSLKNRLSRVTIALEAHAVSSPNDANRDKAAAGGQSRDVIWSGKVDVNEDPITVVIGSAEEGQIVLLAWKTTIVLARPRVRLQAPAILFKVSASLQPPLPTRIKEPNPYLPSGIPLPSNILQPLGVDAVLKTALPQLTTLRLSRPVADQDGQIREILPIKVAARRACRAVPALSSRIRVQKSPLQRGIASMIGALEIDVPPFAQYPLAITDISITLPEGQARNMDEGRTTTFPLTLHARDQLVCLYNLTQDPQATTQGLGLQTLEVLINVSIAVSTQCHPVVQVRFKANVDFSEVSTQNPKANPGPSKGNGLNEKNNSSVSPGDQFITMETPSVKVHDKLGIVIKFTAISQVHVGEPFRWEVFVMNRSGRQRRLGLSMLHKRKTAGEKRVSSRPTSINGARQQKLESIAEAFIDDNLLYTMMKSHNRDTTQLICLNTDVKIGPLNPGSCYSTDMEFLPLAKGQLQIDAIRLTDYTTNEAVDLRDLPDILAIERKQPR